MELTISDDFSLPKIAESGQCFRIRRFVDSTYRFITEGSILYIRELSQGRFEADCTPEDWEAVWSRYFDLGRDYAQLRAAIPKDDTYMRQAAETGRGIRILRQDPWETLVAFIISQRKSIPAIQGAVELLSDRFGTRIVTARETICTFPSPEQLSRADETALSECKLGYRTPYILDAIDKVCSGALNLTALSDCKNTELLEALKHVNGVGEKIANCVALFAYGRAGIAPVDTWIGRVIGERYGGVNPFPAYGDAAGIMQQYVFYYALNHKNELN